MKAIIFDMDGVIFDTERVGDQAWRQAAEEMGFAQIDDAISRCRGLNRADTKAFFEREYPDLDYLAFHKRNHEIMNQLLADGMPVKTGAVELLHWLRQEEWRVALATSTGRESTMHHLEAAHMTDLFDAIITGEQVEHGKPDPEIYEMACDAIGAYGRAVLCGRGFAQRDSQCRGGKSACHHGAGLGEAESGTAGTGSNSTGKPAGRAEVLGEVRRCVID